MIPVKPFGLTGHTSTRIIFGAAGVSDATPAQLEETLQTLLDYGINHIDVAASYGKGECEKRIGTWMDEHRERFFLATKTGMRTYQEAKDEFHASLDRLKVSSVDLIQMHNLTDTEDWETAFGRNGALEALVEAKEKGLTRFIGVTGHGLTAPAMHLRSIERFDCSSVLFPCNYPLISVPDYGADFARLVDTCRGKGIAVQAIKSIARRPWEERAKTRDTWYEPLEEQDELAMAVHWILGHDEIFLISSSDVTLLPRILKSAANFEGQPSNQAMKELSDRRDMRLIFDGTKTIAK
jgi:aryl-alcohol dehydrogenase-like predicted oxidoreductase